jgi:hypothetical protein
MEENVADVKEAAEIAPFVLARLNGALVKLSESPTDGAEGFSAVIDGIGIITHDNVNSLTKDQIGDLYGQLAGVAPKKFKDKAIAVESLLYQVGKVKVHVPGAEKTGKAEKAGKAAGTTAEKAAAKERTTTFVLLAPADAADKLKTLPPQAQAVVSALADVAKAQGGMEVSGKALEERLKAADSPLKTGQPVMRIVGYYKSKLIGAGLIQVH